MIEHKILAPNEGGRSQDQNIDDYKKGIWRICFYDSNSDKVNEAHISRKALLFNLKSRGINNNDVETLRSHLKKWAVQYSNNKKFEDIENNFKIKL
jgi:hypothetical protein